MGSETETRSPKNRSISSVIFVISFLILIYHQKKGELYYSKSIINACRPYTWKNQSPLFIKRKQEMIKKYI